MKIFILLCLAISSGFAAIQNDLVSKLPGFPSNANFAIYSGLLSLPYSNQKQIHYILITQAGQKTTFNNAPLVLWLNGGPGCSSLDGFLVENGPCVFEDGQKELNGSVNAWSWNKFANILYFESPAGVGFSPISGKETYNDTVTTKDSYYALLSFFAGFPELLANKFWISGESYAGIYVPFLGAYIDDQNRLSTATFINLQGILVGNGVGSYSNNVFTEVDFLSGHYFIPGDLYSQFYQYCSQSLTSPNCVSTLNKIDNLTAQINPYDIYRYCYTTDDNNNKLGQSEGWLFNKWIPGTHQELKMAGLLHEEGLTGSEVPCLYTAGIQNYLNRKDVKEALHVDPKTEFSVCNLTINENYYRSPEGSIAKYRQLIAGNYKILVYSGDTDAAVPYTSTLVWIENLGLKVQEAWRPWYLSDQVLGFVQGYEGLTFATVKGVGHQVPAWKRQESYILVTNFINGLPLPKKGSKSTQEVISI